MLLFVLFDKIPPFSSTNFAVSYNMANSPDKTESSQNCRFSPVAKVTIKEVSIYPIKWHFHKLRK